MKYVGYLIFYFIFIFLESFSSLNSIFPSKFEILIPAVIFSVASGGVSSILFTVFFGLITGLSQGFIWININFALFVYLLVNILKNTFHIYSKHFIFILVISTLSFKSIFLFSSKFGFLPLDKNVLFLILIYVLINSLLSPYLINFVYRLTVLINKYEKNTYNP